MSTCPTVPKESHCKWPQRPGQAGLAVLFFPVVPFSLPQHFPSTHEWNSVVVQVPTGPTVDAGTCVRPEWNSTAHPIGLTEIVNPSPIRQESPLHTIAMSTTASTSSIEPTFPGVPCLLWCYVPPVLSLSTHSLSLLDNFLPVLNHPTTLTPTQSHSLNPFHLSKSHTLAAHSS